jgi:hypothetical protein
MSSVTAPAVPSAKLDEMAGGSGARSVPLAHSVPSQSEADASLGSVADETAEFAAAAPYATKAPSFRNR